MENRNTEISSIGEFGLIDRLTKDFPLRNDSSKKGVGDDAAVLSYGDKEVLVTTDLLLEGIHFDLRYVPLKHLGYKSAIVNFSDIYAMNGTPRQITVSLVGLFGAIAIDNVFFRRFTETRDTDHKTCDRSRCVSSDKINSVNFACQTDSRIQFFYMFHCKTA